MFDFSAVDVVNHILGRHWSINSIPLVLKSWNPLFDETREKVEEISL